MDDVRLKKKGNSVNVTFYAIKDFMAICFSIFKARFVFVVFSSNNKSSSIFF